MVSVTNEACQFWNSHILIINQFIQTMFYYLIKYGHSYYATLLSSTLVKPLVNNLKDKKLSVIFPSFTQNKAQIYHGTIKAFKFYNF